MSFVVRSYNLKKLTSLKLTFLNRKSMRNPTRDEDLFYQLWILWEIIDNTTISTLWNTDKKLMLGTFDFIILKLFHQKTACPTQFSEVLPALPFMSFCQIFSQSQKMSKKLILKCTKEKLTKARPKKLLSKFESQLTYLK